MQLLLVGNTIQNLTSASSSAYTGYYTSIIGINISSSTGRNILQNTISNLYSTHATAAVSVYGIYITGINSSIIDTISRNFIHGLSIASSSTSSNISGIYFSSSSASICKNNMIHLGIKPDGTSLTAPCTIYGINLQSVSTNQLYLHNSIYLGGVGVAPGSGGSACIYKGSSYSYTIYNNILYNARTNASTGGNHYTVYISSSGGLCNYNLYYTGVPLACMIYHISTVYTNFASYKSGSGFDANSAIADPRFVNITGNSASVDLHINSVYATPIESFGNSTYTATDDYDGQTRSLFTPVDVGADAGNFTALTLPVKWLSFEGKLADKNSVVLNWKTASEINNDFFEVERSTDNSQWLIVGKVKGNGTTNSVSSYDFIDASAALSMTGILYYRLKQVDFSGNPDSYRGEYSNTITIALHETEDAIIIAPNPFTTHFELLLPTHFNSDVITIEVKDIQGRNVFTQTYSVEKNQAKIAVETNALNSGIYFVNFTTKDGVGKFQKLIKQ